jgi:hypothetical protein
MKSLAEFVTPMLAPVSRIKEMVCSINFSLSREHW